MANPQAALELVTGYSLEMTGKDVPGLMAVSYTHLTLPTILLV